MPRAEPRADGGMDLHGEEGTAALSSACSMGPRADTITDVESPLNEPPRERIRDERSAGLRGPSLVSEGRLLPLVPVRRMDGAPPKLRLGTTALGLGVVAAVVAAAAAMALSCVTHAAELLTGVYSSSRYAKRRTAEGSTVRDADSCRLELKTSEKACESRKGLESPIWESEMGWEKGLASCLMLMSLPRGPETGVRGECCCVVTSVPLLRSAAEMPIS